MASIPETLRPAILSRSKGWRLKPKSPPRRSPRRGPRRQQDRAGAGTAEAAGSDFFQSQPSQKHNAHSPEVVKIHYPFHPLYGQSLRVERRAKLPKGEYLFCELPDGTIGGFPSWIADPTKSPNFTVGSAMTSAAALAELRKLLDSLHSNSQRGTASLKEMRRENTNDT